jgi:hypothetical protein
MTPEAQVDAAIAFLNELLERDSSSISCLCMNRVPCNDQLAEHPTCEIWHGDETRTVGMVGVINGLLTAMGVDRVMVVINENHTQVFRFEKFDPHSALVQAPKHHEERS